MEQAYVVAGFGTAIGIAAAAPLYHSLKTQASNTIAPAVKEFVCARGRFLRELLCWLGVLLVVGFLRVNFWNERVDLMFPEYATYSIAGTINPEPTPTPKAAPRVALRP